MECRTIRCILIIGSSLSGSSERKPKLLRSLSYPKIPIQIEIEMCENKNKSKRWTWYICMLPGDNRENNNREGNNREVKTAKE
jgi:hypothetical protein